MKISVRYVSGMACDYVNVEVTDGGKVVEKKSYTYGRNASYNRKIANWEKQEHDNSIKYGWERVYPLKPYIGDLLMEIFNKYGIAKEDAEYSGFYVFIGREATEEEVKKIYNDLFAEL